MGRQKGVKNSEVSKQKMRENNWSKRGFTPSMLGKHHSEETKKKIALAHIGYKFSDEAKEKMRIAKIGKAFRLGQKHTEESKRKMSLSHIGQIAWNIGRKWSEEHKKRLSVIHRGKILSEEHKRKISENIKDNLPSTSFKKGHKSWNVGTKGIMKSWNKGLKTGLIPKSAFKQGQKPWNWKGGTALYPLGWTKTFREQIRYRDSYKCQLCGMPEVENKKRLSIHHKDYDKENLSPGNLITLCQRCHGKTNVKNRNYWIEYFRRKDEKNNCLISVISNI